MHPLEVAVLLERSHYPNHVVAAAVLHDVLEALALLPPAAHVANGTAIAK
jgi:hypothetical protein